MNQKKHKSTVKRQANVLTLSRYLPYRLSVLSNLVSARIAETYSDKFALSITEWRIIAVLGEESGISAEEVSVKTRIEKSILSRAINRLLSRRIVARGFDPNDRRRSMLTLTKTGQSVYAEVVPIAVEMEQQLLQGFSKTELHRLSELLDRLSVRAEELLK